MIYTRAATTYFYLPKNLSAVLRFKSLLLALTELNFFDHIGSMFRMGIYIDSESIFIHFASRFAPREMSLCVDSEMAFVSPCSAYVS